MKNLIVIDTFGECACACITNIYDGTNSIIIMFEANHYTNPKIEVTYGETTITANLDIVNGFAVYIFPYSIFNTTTACDFRYVDGEKIGAWFKIYGLYGGTVPPKKTLKVNRLDVRAFSFGFIPITKTPETVITTYNPDDFVISEDGELSLKDDATVTQIIATDKNGRVTNVKLKYSDNTESSNDCKYDDDTGKLIKFGDLPIDWSYITE